MPSKPASMARLHEPADRSGADPLGGDGAGSIDAREECTRACGAESEPSVECPDGIGPTVLPAGYTDELPVAVLVCLGPAYGYEDAGGLGDDVGEVECGELAGTQR